MGGSQKEKKIKVSEVGIEPMTLILFSTPSALSGEISEEVMQCVSQNQVLDFSELESPKCSLGPLSLKHTVYEPCPYVLRRSLPLPSLNCLLIIVTGTRHLCAHPVGDLEGAPTCPRGPFTFFLERLERNWQEACLLDTA